ncbi:hypothetical protein [Lentzea flava]|uniref:Uncharacterized protein n=1 Tax=Lentzea flava TaxID=103732 RepID=A0ABQ2UBX6_9PSEU|nr:hypothetical protein [Lentzea flava]MCP2197136.1 hypothetical protein [Lentzea flava]GGU13102.1 hypothetical protein GCM10010178_00300 [Lentzea flava]
MRLPETNAQSAATRAATRKIGLRIAALTGVVLTAGAIAAAPSIAAELSTDAVLDSVVATDGGGTGSTCCRPEN